jgi:hypothetical protein
MNVASLGMFLLYRFVMSVMRYVVPCFTDWQGDPVEAGNFDHDVVKRGSQIMYGLR